MWADTRLWAATRMWAATKYSAQVPQVPVRHPHQQLHALLESYPAGNPTMRIQGERRHLLLCPDPVQQLSQVCIRLRTPHLNSLHPREGQAPYNDGHHHQH
jgi:hypothetical protein